MFNLHFFLIKYLLYKRVIMFYPYEQKMENNHVDNL